VNSTHRFLKILITVFLILTVTGYFLDLGGPPAPAFLLHDVRQTHRCLRTTLLHPDTPVPLPTNAPATIPPSATIALPTCSRDGALQIPQPIGHPFRRRRGRNLHSWMVHSTALGRTAMQSFKKRCGIALSAGRQRTINDTITFEPLTCDVINNKFDLNYLDFMFISGPLLHRPAPRVSSA
jgi:hypothetical protein